MERQLPQVWEPAATAGQIGLYVTGLFGYVFRKRDGFRKMI